MEILIKGTEEVITLTLISPRSGVNMAQDFVGDIDGVDYDEDLGYYVADRGTAEYWASTIEQAQALEDRIYDLKQEHGHEAVDDVLQGEVYEVEPDAQIERLKQKLDEVFGTVTE